MNRGRYTRECVPRVIAPPARIAAATSVASANSCSAAPAFFAWTSVQYEHWVVSATATAIRSVYRSGITPPRNAAASNATNAWKVSEASSPSSLSLGGSFMPYTSVSSGGIGRGQPPATSPARGRRAHEPYGLLGRPQGVGHEPEVDQRRPVAVPLLVRRAGRRVPDHRHLEPVLQKVPQVGLDAQIPGRAEEDHLLDPPLPELEH